MDADGSIDIPTLTAHCDDRFQREMCTRLSSIEAKLDVISQLMSPGHPSKVAGYGLAAVDKAPGTSMSKVTWAEEQQTATITLGSMVLPGTCIHESEAFEGEAYANPMNVSEYSNMEPTSERCDPNSESCESDCKVAAQNSHNKNRRPTRVVPHVDLDKGVSWMRQMSSTMSHSRTLHRFGIVSCIDRIKGRCSSPSQEELDRARRTRLWKLVNSWHFRNLCSTMVILNVIFVGAVTEAELLYVVQHKEFSKLWYVGEIVFILYFLAEISLRFIAEKLLFFNGPNWKWNLFDFLVVLSSMIEIGYDFSSTELSAGHIVIARILRLSRLLRIVSVVRVMRAFRTLRLVVLTIVESTFSLTWVLLILGTIIFTFAVFVVQGVTAHLRWQDAVVVDTDIQQLELREELLELYGGVTAACVCLFMMVSGGIDWKDAMIPMKKVDGVYEYFFTFYVFFMVIGVLNVVMAAFVAATGEMASRDRDFIVQAQMAQLASYFGKVKTFFAEADVDASGKLSYDEFKMALMNKNVCAYFNALGIDVSQADSLFLLLDKDNSRMLSLEEFLAGCMRLQGAAKSLDVNLLLHENKTLSRRVKELRDCIRAAQNV